MLAKADEIDPSGGHRLAHSLLKYPDLRIALLRNANHQEDFFKTAAQAFHQGNTALLAELIEHSDTRQILAHYSVAGPDKASTWHDEIFRVIEAPTPAIVKGLVILAQAGVIDALPKLDLKEKVWNVVKANSNVVDKDVENRGSLSGENAPSAARLP